MNKQNKKERYCNKCKKEQEHTFVFFRKEQGYVWYCQGCGNTLPNTKMIKELKGGKK